MKTATPPITLSQEERQTLERWARMATSEQRAVLRARIILAAAAGQGGRANARELTVCPATVTTWRRCLGGRSATSRSTMCGGYCGIHLQRRRS